MEKRKLKLTGAIARSIVEAGVIWQAQNFLLRSLEILQPPYRTPKAILDFVERDKIKNVIGNPPFEQ